MLDKSKVRGSGGQMLTDIVSLVRYALDQDDELVPFRDQVEERFCGMAADPGAERASPSPPSSASGSLG